MGDIFVMASKHVVRPWVRSFASTTRFLVLHFHVAFPISGPFRQAFINSSTMPQTNKTTKINRMMSPINPHQRGSIIGTLTRKSERLEHDVMQLK
jgi:hypothetical protein